MTAQQRAAQAQKNFLDGYNCPQSVVHAFDDVLQKNGIDVEAALRLASPFGGGMGRMREVCGAVSGMFMILGLLEGYSDPAAFDAKADLYATAQELAAAFREEHGTILCRELLGLQKGPDAPTPERRTAAYYADRPCAAYCETAARVLAEHLGE